MNIRKLLDWKTVLIYLHRWMGIVLGLVFVVWFISGVAMMYVGMPRLSAAERLGHIKSIDLSAARVEPAEAARGNGIEGRQLRVEMYYDGRPIYRFDGNTKVYADTGERVGGASKKQALALVRAWVPQFASSVRYDGYLTNSDQWTLGERRGTMPLHRIAVGDSAGTHYYISEVTGEPTMKTDRRSRVLGYVSAVLHWTYFTSLRRNGPLWLKSVAWAALVGAFMTLAGLIVGVVRTRFIGYYRMRGGPSHSPYAGWMKWHHYAGLIFGVVTITWAISGAMSLDYPLNLHNQPPTRAQRTAVARSPLRLEDITIARMRAALKQVEPSFQPKELEVVQFQGEPYFLGAKPPAPYSYEREIGSNDERSQGEARPEHLIVPALHAERGAFGRFSDDSMWTIAKAAMPGMPLRDAAWLTEYDPYYYDQYGNRPLPVLRLRYEDADATWLYLEPSRGTLTKQDRGGRWNRWLYHGLHSLDFPFMYYRRPLWDIVVIGLSIGGLVLSATTLVPSWRRLARHARRLAATLHVRPVRRFSMRNSTLWAAIAALLLATGSASAHHTFSKDFDRDKPITLNGTVTRIQWTSPHVYTFINVKDDTGKMTNWKVEMGSPAQLTKAGWTRDKLKVGEMVTLQGWRAKNGTSYANAEEVTMSTGEKLSAESSYKAPGGVATSGKTTPKPAY